ncbi:Unannotated [Lentimonas sp. CC11]|nr:Unannotated [Lentimonas sp. CC11]
MRDATCFVGVLLAAPAMAGGVTEPCVHVAFARTAKAGDVAELL